MSDRTARPPSTRKQQKAQTRERLKRAGRELFAEIGYDTAQIADIAKRAQVAQGTLYVHFPNKQALLEELLEELNAGLVSALEGAWTRAAKHGAEAAIRALGGAYLRYWMEQRDLVRVLTEGLGRRRRSSALPSGFNPMAARFVERALSRLATELGVQLANPHLVVHGLIGLWFRIGIQYVFAERPHLAGAVDALVRMSLGALEAMLPGFQSARLTSATPRRG